MGSSANGSYVTRNNSSGSFFGVAYAYYDDDYTAQNVLDELTFYDANGVVVATESLPASGGYFITLNGVLWQADTVHADGSYDMYYTAAGTFYGLAYSAYDNSFTAAGVLDQTTVYDANGAVVGTQTYLPNGSFAAYLNGALTYSDTINADGSYDEHDVAAGSFYGVAYASYTQSYTAAGFRYQTTVYDAAGHVLGTQTYLPNGSFAAYLNGALTYSDMINADGSYDEHDVAAGTFYGVAYASYTQSYDAAGFRYKTTVYDANGNVVGTQTYLPNGSFAAYLNGALYYSDIINADGSYDLYYGQAAGSFFGETYASADATYSASGVLETATFYDAKGAALLTQTFQADGAYTVTLGAAFLQNVTADWLNSLSPAEVAALTAADLAPIPSPAFGGVTVAFAQNISVAAMTGLTSDELEALLPGVLAVFSAAQLAALTTNQISNLTSAELQGFNSAFWSSTNWVTLAATWLTTLPAAAVAGMTPAMFAYAGTAQLLALGSDAIKALTKDQVTAFSLANPPGFWSSVPASWLNNLTPSAAAGIGAAALAQLPPATVALLSPDTFQALQPVWSSLTPQQTAVLTPAQFGNVSVNDPTVFKQLSYPWALNVAVVALLTDTLLATLPTSDFSYFDAQWLNELPAGALDKLDQDQIQAILPQYFSYMNASIVGSLTASQVDDLTAAQVAQFTPADFRALSANVQYLPDDDLTNLTTDQLAFVSLSHFTAPQIATSPALQFEYATDQLTNPLAIYFFGVANLTAPEIQALSPSLLFALANYKLGAAKVGLSAIDSFSAEQLLDMSGQQYAIVDDFLSSAQHTNFEIDTVRSTSAQVASLASSWTSTSYGAGTLGDPSIWPHLVAVQVEAISNAGAINANDFQSVAQYLATSVISQNGLADARNTLNDLESLSDSAFAGLGQGSGATGSLEFLIAESGLLQLPISTKLVETISPTAWEAALNGLPAAFTSLSFNSSSAQSVIDYFENAERSTSWYVYHQSQLDPNWLPSDPSALTADALAELSASQVQRLTIPQLYSLSATQYDAIYSRLTAAQTQGLLYQEFAALPAADQASFLDAGGLNGDIQALLNPTATLAQLFSGAFTTADQAVAQTLITIYDQNFSTIAAQPDRFKQLTTLYNLLETRSNALISNSSITAQITADVDSILNDFTLYNAALSPAAPASDSRTDVTNYVETVNNGLNSAVGGVSALVSDLKGLAAIVDNVGALVLDNTTEATPMANLAKWALDGSPNANTPAGSGNLTYNGVAGYTFQTALENVIDQLFTNADNFVKNAQGGIASVVAGQSAANESAEVSNILDIVSAVAGAAGGLGGVVSSFSDIANLAEDADSIFKTVQSLDTDVSEAKSATTVFGNIGSSLLSESSNLVEVADYTLPFLSSSSDGEYASLANSGDFVYAYVDDLTSYLTSGDATAANAIQAAQAFASDYNTLLTTIDSNLNQKTTQLASLTVDNTIANSGGTFNQTLYDQVKNAGVSPITFELDYFFAGIDFKHESDDVALYPTNVPVSYTDTNGNTQVVDLNLYSIFGQGEGEIAVLNNADQSDNLSAFNGNHDVADTSQIVYTDYTAVGPNIAGYAASTVTVRLALHDPNAPLGGDVWQINQITLTGNNPI